FYTFIMDSNSDPAEAFAVYLTIAHVFAVWELQKVKLPRADHTSAELDLADVYSLVAPRRHVSLGNHSAGRQLERFSFPEIARPWLTKLISRFQEQRSRILNGRKRDYLFVAPGRTHNNVPVSTAYIRTLILRASKRALGYE